MRRVDLLSAALILLLIGSLAPAADAPIADGAKELKKIPPLAQRAKWFEHDRFGMFIHWGVYSVEGRGEWVRTTAKIPLDEYNKLHPKFNPKDFNAEEWVLLAKRAGQKYIVITTKHHDGFCMFDSKLTDYTIMNTPLKRDICKELADACRKHDMKLGFYYSIMDWRHPDYVPVRGWEKNRSTKDAKFERYVEYMRGQIRELMTGYGPIVALWFDGGWEHTKPADKKAFKEIIDMARQLQPNLLVNDRAAIGGDYKTPEQQIPATGVLMPDGRPAMWEVCMTMSSGQGSFPPTGWWGYDKNEKAFKPTEELLHKLVDITSKGGNFLLNVGPTPEGVIRAEETERLEAVGQWMVKHGESIYGTTASPFRLLPFFGRVTTKGNRLYVHVFDWPTDGKLVLPGLKTLPTKGFMLGQPEAQVTAAAGEREGLPEVVLTLPSDPTDPIDSVVVLDFDATPQVEPLVLRPGKDGRLVLPAAFAEIQAQHGQKARPMSESGRTYVGNWRNPRDVVAWQITMPKPGKYTVKLNARPASKEAVGQRVVVEFRKQKLEGKVTPDGVKLAGRLDLPAGKHTLQVRLLDAKPTEPPVLDLFGLELAP
ncbi:MAG: alpha-L-fucosidase [Pirellulales bacterium]|nr:alpha-L-fucosidase [Pirellulales bacterium]